MRNITGYTKDSEVTRIFTTFKEKKNEIGVFSLKNRKWAIHYNFLQIYVGLALRTFLISSNNKPELSPNYQEIHFEFNIRRHCITIKNIQ